MIIPKPQRIIKLDQAPYVVKAGDNAQAVLKEAILDTTLSQESYLLTIGVDGAKISYGSEVSKAYAIKSLEQLLSTCDGTIDAMQVEDEPSINYRGYMLDVSRYFFTVEEVFEQIDFMAEYKFNALHLHLTDDQGWRVEIKSHPKLAEIGSVRYRTLFKLRKHTGYYTQEDLKRIVDYAHSRNIIVIPEVDLPGHFQSAVAAYPELGCYGDGVKVAENFGVKYEVACIGKESTVSLIKDVLKELAEIFTDEYFHIGGDEVPSHRWSHCPHCKAKYEALGCKNWVEYQAHFMNELASYLKSLGKKVIMWNETEITGLIDKDVIWQYWQGGLKEEDLVKEVNNGRKVIVSCCEPYYLDLPYSINGLKRVYEHKPCFDGMNRNNFIGAETCMWSELVPNVKVLKRRAFPRLLAVAEGIWNGSGSYDDFIDALKTHRAVLARYGVKNTPKCKYEPKGLIKLALNLWWARRVLYWGGLQNVITNAKIERLSKRR